MRRGRNWIGAARPPPGFQRHHILPLALLRRPQMEDFLQSLASADFILRNFAQNGLLLPSQDWSARATGHALHRGPHDAYTDVITARVDQIRSSFAAMPGHEAGWVAVGRLRTLQAAMRRALTDRHGHGFWLNRRDPMRLFADRPYLDSAIDRMFGAPDQP